MNLRRWLSTILALGLVVALTPIYAMAWQNRGSGQQYNRGSGQQYNRGAGFNRGSGQQFNRGAGYNRGYAQQYNRGYAQRQPWGNAYGRQGLRPPMYRHHHYGQQYGGQYGYGQQNPGYQLQAPVVIQGGGSGYSSGAPSGILGFLQSLSGNVPSTYDNGQNTTGNWRQNRQQGRYNQQGQYNHRSGRRGGTTTTPSPTTTTAPHSSGGLGRQL